jgi:hypothetical protein
MPTKYNGGRKRYKAFQNLYSQVFLQGGNGRLTVISSQQEVLASRTDPSGGVPKVSIVHGNPLEAGNFFTLGHLFYP